MNTKYGCDPELFVFDRELDRIVPAVGLVKGTKDKPHELSDGMVQLDGTLVEFGISPTRTPGGFLINCRNVIRQIEDMLDSVEAGRYQLRCGSTVRYHADDIDTNSDAFDVGCSPQYKLEGGVLRQVSGVSRIVPERVHAGGHIHIGFTKNQSITNERMLISCQRLSDCLAETGIMQVEDPLPIDERQKDVFNNETRPVVRVKPYGIEFRNLSSYWLASGGQLASVLGLANLAVAQARGGSRSCFMRNVLDNSRRSVEAMLTSIENQDAKYQGTLPLFQN